MAMHAAMTLQEDALPAGLHLEDEKIKKQLELEEESIEWGIEQYRTRWSEAIRSGSISEMPPGMRILNASLEPMTAAVAEFIVPRRGGGHLGHVRSLVKSIPAVELSFLTIRTVVDEIVLKQPSQEVAVKIGQNVLDLIEYKKFKTHNPGYLYAIERNFHTHHPGHRRTVLMLQKRKAGIQDEPWSQETKFHIGWKLLDLLIGSTGIVERVIEWPHRYGWLKPTAHIERYFREANAQCEVLHPACLPMVVPPIPWEGVYGGGYLSNHRTNRHKLIRTTNSKVVAAQEEMTLVYRAVNALQETPWRINRRIYEVVREMWDTSSGMGVLPDPDGDDLPAKPWTSDEEYRRLKLTSPDIVQNWKREAHKVHTRNAEARSRRFTLKMQLLLAEKFLSEPEIFFCWFLDFRGRMYPLQTHLNPYSDETGRALLEFAEGKPVGERGIYWLAVHGANCYGMDKVPFDDRVRWIYENEPAVLDSAENPLDGRRFWTDAGKPFQFLAFCYDWAGLKRDGVNFISHLPVRLDGTCNGLQHFSALLRDTEGARATNLTPSAQPSDIYGKVADVVSELVEKDLQNHAVFTVAKNEEDNQEPDVRISDMARGWCGKIDRKLCKHSVMTTPYGVTIQGLRNQILEELREGNEDFLSTEDHWNLSIYLAEKVHEAIGRVVVAAQEGKHWLQGVAKIVNETGGPICWTAPSGFKVQQECLEQRDRIIETVQGKKRVRITLKEDTNQLNKIKQFNGISPNFIHSLDASHLVLTINKCLDAGICDFAMVHDSYGTHAADIARMASILREAFIDMYSTAVLERFRNEIISQLPSNLASKVPPLPAMGDFNVGKVKESLYFFS
jgi:DNA-directed RNA polymerase